MDERPAVWVGHLVLPVNNIDAAKAFWLALGMRHIETNEHVVVLELRGGTHLILLPETKTIPAGEVPFDLMVDDLEATHAEWDDLGLGPSEITKGRIHASFTVRDPDGRELTVNSTHVVGIV